MRCSKLIVVFLVLVALLGCEMKTERPEGIYQSTSYNTGKKVVFDFKEDGEVYVEVSRVNISDKVVDDAFFPFFAEGKSKQRWTMVGKGHLISLQNENGFEIVRLEYTGKSLTWDKTKFTRE